MRHKKPGHSNGHSGHSGGHQKRSHNGGGHSHHNSRNKYSGAGRSHGGADDARVRKNATASREKYIQMAKDALSSGDRVLSEYYLQHADHYYRVVAALPPEEAQRKVVPINSEVALETTESTTATAHHSPSEEKSFTGTEQVHNDDTRPEDSL